MQPMSPISHSGPRVRLGPSVAVGVAVWFAYSALTYAVQASAGVPYAEWFATAANAWRVGVLSLAVGTLLLIVFVSMVRWNHVWRDPQRLPTTTLMKAAMALWCLAIVVRLIGVRWSDVPLDLLWAIVGSGVLVGFAEETLFRGIFLRSLREGGRSEGRAAVWTSLCFGLFHLSNVWMGMGLVGLLQVFLAATSGVVLYVFRRHFGVLWPAMLAHGAWDISTFLTGSYAMPWVALTSLALQAGVVLLGIAILVGLWRGGGVPAAVRPAS
jgi:membrane protease YdiL (CAAX protease family)